MVKSLISPGMLAVAIVFPILSTGIVGLRLYSRRLPHQTIAADDWMALTTLASSCLCTPILRMLRLGSNNKGRSYAGALRLWHFGPATKQVWEQSR